MKTSYLACGMGVVGIGLIIVACGGADSSTNDVLGAAPTTASTTASSSSSGGTSTSSSTGGTTTSSSSSTTSSSGVVCAPCLAPPAGCTPNNGSECDCSYTCPPDAGPPPPTACTWAKTDPCPAGMYCDAPTCLKGVCVAKAPSETVVNDPQCGCDGVTYFNTSVAAKNGMAIQAKNACADGVQATCGGPIDTPCPSATNACNHEVKNKAQCMMVEGAGECWQMPAGCTPNANTPKNARACSGNGCSDMCTAISSRATWFPDATCPN